MPGATGRPRPPGSEPREPWRQPGWRTAVSAWIEALLAGLGRRRAGPLEPVRGSGLSAVLRVPTAAGDLYFKQPLRLPSLGDETSLTGALAALFPGRVPAVVGCERRRGWLLLEDFGRPVGAVAPPEVWRDVFAALARLQVDAAPHVDELAAAGCRRLELDRWAPRIAPALEEAAASLPALSAEERERLRRTVPRMEDVAGELGRSGLPPTLVHGDLHLANVARSGGGYLAFDWADACVSHPLLDVAYVFAEAGEHGRPARDAYLAGWSGHATMERLERLWALAEPASALHQAMTYLETARHLSGPLRQRFLGGAAYFVRRLLAA